MSCVIEPIQTLLMEPVLMPSVEIPDGRREKPSVAVVIPMWNKEVDTCVLAYNAVNSVFIQTDRAKVDLKVVLVDNHSPVQATWVGSAHDWDVILLRENRGFGPAVNLGMRVHPRTDYVCQMNSDAELVEDSISILIDVVEKFGVDVVMPEHYENCKHYGLGKSDELMGSDWRFGAFWIMPRAVWDGVGGFDEDFEMCYWEDTALWAKLQASGRKIAGWRGTWVKHAGGASSHPDRDFYFERNRRLFEDKWGRKTL
jgi:GT2 family glycosyltransferase